MLEGTAYYLLRGFATEQAAKKRSRELWLARNPPNDRPYDHAFECCQIATQEWALVVPPHMTDWVPPGDRLEAVPREFTWMTRHPAIYRYLDQCWIDEFFATGSIRLSCFAEFKRHDDIRRDTTEGANTLMSAGQQDTVVSLTFSGRNAYVLCGSVRESPQLLERFGCDGYFRIDRPVNFGMAIAHKLPDCVSGLEGHCLYRDKREIRRDVGPIDLDSMRISEDSKELDMGKLFQKVDQIGGTDVYFVKQFDYEAEQEYRLLWLNDGPVSQPTTVVCPEALAFCTKIT